MQNIGIMLATKTTWLMVLVLSQTCLSNAFGSDKPCKDRKGHCQNDSTSCSGNYVSNLCSGSASRRCCLPPASSGQCSDIGGICQRDYLHCTGFNVTGKCSGSATSHCCISLHIHGHTI